jgi:hypothetical protein
MGVISMWHLLRWIKELFRDQEYQESQHSGGGDGGGGGSGF